MFTVNSSFQVQTSEYESMQGNHSLVCTQTASQSAIVWQQLNAHINDLVNYFIQFLFNEPSLSQLLQIGIGA